MIMIETVQERQRGAYNFENYYDNLCALQDTCPIPAVKGHLHEGIFDINGDRIRQQDWTPIFNSIKINKSLKFISIRSYFQLNLENGMPEKKAKIMRSRIPVIRTKEMTASLCKVLRDCLATTESLECLELQGIHLRESDITVIGQGLMKNSTLKHLSLESCRIGDSGLVMLCSAMKMAGNISTLNLTSCSLSPIGIGALGDLIKFQAMSRHNEAWKESLRYRWANFDTMCGIRRMTLNCNLGIGDEGALILAESLKDDLWVKAIDLQECSLTNSAVRGFLKVLKFNSTLVVLDLRRNPMIDRDLLKSVTEQVLVNGDGKETEYKWLRVKDLMRNTEENYDRHPRSYYNGPTKPLDVVVRPVFKPAGRLRSKSAGSIDRRSNDIGSEDIHGKISADINSARNYNNSMKGQPWRTAARATRYKGYPPDHIPGKNNIEEHYEDCDKFPQPERSNKKVDCNVNAGHIEHKSKKQLSTVEKQSSLTTDDDQTSSVVSPLVNGAVHYPPIPESVKELKTEIFHLRVQLDKYQKDKSEIEMKLDEIHTENKRLRNTIKIMSKTNAVIAERAENSSILQNAAILETIENSFKQFNAFLDMLRQSGLGKIVTAAGMDQFTTSQEVLYGVNKLHSKTNGAAKQHFPDDEEEENDEPIGVTTPKEIEIKKNLLSNENSNNINDDHILSNSGEWSAKKRNSKNESHQKNGAEATERALHHNDHFEMDEDNASLESVGWKNHSKSKNSKNQSNKLADSPEGDHPVIFNERDSYNKSGDPIDNEVRPSQSNMEGAKLSDDSRWNDSDNYQSSTSSLATNSKVTKTANEAQRKDIEDSTVVTESMDNGMDHEINMNNPYSHQLSLDTAQDISFDHSIQELL